MPVACNPRRATGAGRTRVDEAEGAGFGSRRAARERAVELLYEAELKGTSPVELMDQLPVPPDDYAQGLVRDADADRAAAEQRIGELSEHWELHRMPVLDRVILRLGTVELAHRPDVPAKVVINEAVELAKRYSTEQSSRFVNGLLSRLAGEVRPGELDRE